MLIKIKKELIKINDEKLNMLFNFIYSKQKIFELHYTAIKLEKKITISLILKNIYD